VIGRELAWVPQVGNQRGKRRAEIVTSMSGCGVVAGNWRQPIHVVGKGDQMGGMSLDKVSKACETHRRCGRPRKGADMRQALRGSSGFSNSTRSTGFALTRGGFSTRASSFRGFSKARLEASACSLLFHGSVHLIRG